MEHLKTLETPIEFSINQGMISGQGEQACRKYKKIQGKTRTWYVAIQENEGDNIYVTPDSRENTFEYKGFRGFGGATLSFELEDGTVDKVQGPWHSNCEALLQDTGYDVTQKYYTQGIVALDCNKTTSNDWMRTSHKEVLHYDEKPVLGSFERIRKIAQDFANNLQRSVYYAVKTRGGASSAWLDPNCSCPEHLKNL